MRPRISEFSYGFALTRELIATKWNGLELTAAPFLPSLVQEGRSGGFDVALTSVKLLVFLQFKVSHLLTRSTAKGVSNGVLTVPYYRFDLHAPRVSDQHKLLQELERSGAGVPRIVRYVAPAFFTEGEFDHLYLANGVSERSLFVSPSDVQLPDDEEHSIGFRMPTDAPVLLSEPTRLERAGAFQDFDEAVKGALARGSSVAIDGQDMELTRESLVTLAEAMKPDATPDRRGGREDRFRTEKIPFAADLPRLDTAMLRTVNPLEAIGRLAWTQFGCEAIAIGTAQGPTGEG